MWNNDPSTNTTGSALRPVMTTPTAGRSEHLGLNLSSPPASERSWLRSAVPAVLVAMAVFGLGVAATSTPSLLPKSIVPVDRPPVQLNGDAIPQAAQPTLLELVERGDPKAITELKRKGASERTIEETLALDTIRRRDASIEVIELGKVLQTKRPEEIPSESIEKMMDYVGDDLTERTALAELAKIPNFLGADLIYKASRIHRRKPSVVLLANELLSTGEVTKRASPAMAVIVGAMNAKTCDEARAVLKLAHQDADRRSVIHLARFGERTGCGPSGIDDCFECLRGDRLLVESVRGAQDRIEPF